MLNEHCSFYVNFIDCNRPMKDSQCVFKMMKFDFVCERMFIFIFFFFVNCLMTDFKVRF